MFMACVAHGHCVHVCSARELTVRVAWGRRWCCVQLLYSSPFGGALVIVSDKNNRLVGTSDAFPETLELPAGTYTVRVQVKHDRIELLERMKTLPLTVKRKLSSDVRAAAGLVPRSIGEWGPQPNVVFLCGCVCCLPDLPKGLQDTRRRCHRRASASPAACGARHVSSRVLRRRPQAEAAQGREAWRGAHWYRDVL